MTDKVAELALVDTARNRIQEFIKAQPDTEFDRPQYNIEVGSGEYTFTLQVTGYGIQVLQVITTERGVKFDFQITAVGTKTLPLWLITNTIEDFASLYLQKSSPEPVTVAIPKDGDLTPPTA
jgi:hypothetical protein